MITKFQFQAVCKLLSDGVNDYVQIRQRVGLTSAELDDIIKNFDYYAGYFRQQDELLKQREQQNKKKHWWQK